MAAQHICWFFLSQCLSVPTGITNNPNAGLSPQQIPATAPMFTVQEKLWAWKQAIPFFGAPGFSGAGPESWSIEPCTNQDLKPQSAMDIMDEYNTAECIKSTLPTLKGHRCSKYIKICSISTVYNVEINWVWTEAAHVLHHGTWPRCTRAHVIAESTTSIQGLP